MHVPQPVATRWSDIESALPFSELELLADVARLRVRHRVRAVYVGGSRADGYGNARSDIDVYALVDEPVVRQPGEGFAVSCIGHRHIQYDFVSIPFLEDAIDQLQSSALEKIRLSTDDLKLLHRLCNSVAVSGCEIVRAYAERVRAAGFARLCAHRKAWECENGIQDAYGAWESGHVETAVYMLRTAVRLALDALVSLCGETANNDKWIFPRSVRAFGPDHPLCITFRNLYRHIPAEHEQDELQSCFEDSFRFVQVCLDALCANETARATAAAPPLNPLAQHVLKALDATIPNGKSPHVYLRRTDSKVLLHHRGLLKQELSERAAVLWWCAGGGSSPGGAASAAACLRPDLFVREADAQEMAERLCARWTAAGYLRPPMTSAR
jgi:hypothetical protein